MEKTESTATSSGKDRITRLSFIRNPMALRLPKGVRCKIKHFHSQYQRKPGVNSLSNRHPRQSSGGLEVGSYTTALQLLSGQPHGLGSLPTRPFEIRTSHCPGRRFRLSQRLQSTERSAEVLLGISARTGR